ncbi:hypothetical protein [Thioalkalivibrio sp. ALE17]|uniref:hypothetical protein n=1 Tax=Thioalkalivibrio sp. ALE17 TaxID=1158173 RepID=UPI00040DFC23|nr:hypothetical protein [Thioalkalivibrio sp. ALE17]
MKKALLIVPLALLSVSAHAATVDPTYQFFGALPEADFGGSGIPNDSVAQTPFETAEAPGLLGLSAAQRFGSPEVTNDGAGTFFAQPGISDPTYESNFGSGLSLWNLNFYIDPGTGSLAGAPLTFELYFETVPGQISTLQLGSLEGVEQGSQNLGFNWLNDLASAQGNDPFDPFAEGLYSFGLAAFEESGGVQPLGTMQQERVAEPIRVAETWINVQVGDPTAVSEPGSAWMLGTGLGMLALMAWGVGRRRPGAGTA